ncbi:DUF2948 family protein [Fuscibacter oryzae]|uniref:DUF2948 family protein n=1 Tax=Fuscibacter oryzae TaxID=2803939 RepID=A0A8J7MRY4_9RHOB|nr:DUF2948 family protein [Fuscibacter oryzae]MBL4927644.1 DUF2948 family protein [Fuscibacter oryzae]
MTDARYEDGDEQPLRLIARAADDLPVLAALVQDAVLAAADMTYARPRRRFALFLNRFRWEDREAATSARRPYERVRALLVIEEVLAVKTQGIQRDGDTVLSLLDISFADKGEGAGTLTLTFAGDGAIALEVEALGLSLRDVTRPYVAPSGKVPDHGM